MCDLFSRLDAYALLTGKSVLLMGDSILRNIYKDIVFLLNPETEERLIPK